MLALTPDLLNDLMIFDDVGSIPLPKGVSKEWYHQAINSGDPEAQLIVYRSMLLKLESGVELPSYPQHQEMNVQFLRLILDGTKSRSGLVIDPSYAKIPELEALLKFSEQLSQYRDPLEIKVCVTGPIQLGLRLGLLYQDALEQLALSVNHFLRNSQLNTKHLVVKAMSIDEPSLGLASLELEHDFLISILERAAQGIQPDLQLHLHSPALYQLGLQAAGIDVIGIESAADPRSLEVIDPKLLEQYDKWLRLGVARSDLDGMAMEYYQSTGIDPWRARSLDKVVELESPQLICSRINSGLARFRNRIKYLGPDCGLGAWPDQELAKLLLRNISRALQLLRQPGE